MGLSPAQGLVEIAYRYDYVFADTGFHINIEKLVLQPTTLLTFLGFDIDLRFIHDGIPRENWEMLKERI